MKRASEREEQMVARRRRMEEIKQSAASTAELISSGSVDSSKEDDEKMETEANASEGLLEVSHLRHRTERGDEKLSLLQNSQQLSMEPKCQNVRPFL